MYYRRTAMLVYLATNSVSGMQYVGAALCLNKRKSAHLSAARRGRGSKNSLQEAIRVYGEDNFIFSVLDTAKDRKDLSKKEHQWIDKLNTVHPNGYNLLRGNYSTDLKNSGKYVSVKVEGRTFPTINAAAKHYGVSVSSFRNRLQRGWTPEQAVDLVDPPEDYREQKTFVPITLDGKTFKCSTDAAKHYGIVLCTMRQRLNKGFTPEQAVGLEPAPKNRFLHPNMNNITIKGKTFDSERQACLYFSEKIGIKARTLKARLKKGWDWDDVLSPEISHRARVPRKNNNKYVVGDKVYRTSDELGAAYGISGSYARVLIYKNKGKPLNDIFLKGDNNE